jgi:hypothetical protein
VVAVALRLQAAELEKLPALLAEKPTVPVGVVFVPLPVSLTVAMQVVVTLTATEEGEQLTLVAVGAVESST